MTDPLPKAARVLLLLSAGAWLAVAVPDALAALARPGVPVLWWTARASGLAAHGALWLSMIFGVFVGARGAGGLLPPPVVAQLHGRWSLAALGLTVAHVAAVVLDRHAGVGPLAVVLPLASPVHTVPVALGTVALLGLGAVWATTVARRTMSAWVWRAVHATAFGTFLLALLHGVAAGTDTSAPGVAALYVGTAAALVGAVVQRVLLAVRPADDRARAG